jgi:hypothetical protein
VFSLVCPHQSARGDGVPARFISANWWLSVSFLSSVSPAFGVLLSLALWLVMFSIAVTSLCLVGLDVVPVPNPFWVGAFLLKCDSGVHVATPVSKASGSPGVRLTFARE